jgi:hypothetical protein
MKFYHWIYLYGIAVFCLVMSFIFSSLPNRTVGLPASLAFLFLGMLSGVTAAALRAIEKRLDILEEAKPTKETLKRIPNETQIDIKPHSID